jgi:F-type H+-transporting ATPase subunit c
MRKRMLVVVVGLLLLALAAPVFAQEGGAAAASPAGRDMWKFIGAAFVLGVAALGGALGQGRAVASACTSMGRNPGAAGPVRITMLLGVAFIESLVIYAMVIAFLILAK